MADEDRVCIGCGLVPPAGPLTYSWDAHRVFNKDAKKGERFESMVMTCSDDCRERVGFRTRRVPSSKPMGFDL